MNNKESEICDLPIQSSICKSIKLKRILKVIGNIVFAFLIILVLFICFFVIQGKLTGDVPSAFGYRLYVVLTGSMEPAVPAGSLAVVGANDPANLKFGDVVTYRNFDSGKIITHRIVSIDNTDGSLQFTTRGDANDTDDFTPVMPADIIGKVVFSIPLIGALMEFARSKTGLLVFAIIPGLMIIVYELRKLFRYAVILDRKKEAASQASAEDSGAASPPEEPGGH